MPRLCFSNELISCNEGLHCDFACLLYSKLINRLPESHIMDIISSAVNIEMEFVVDGLPVELIGMNSPMMCDYIKFCTDGLFITLRCQCHYNTRNPFEWMEMISLQGKTNFFEKHVGEYAKLGVGVESTAAQIFSLDISFYTTIHTANLQHDIIYEHSLSMPLVSEALQKTKRHVEKIKRPLKSNDFLSNGIHSPCPNALSPSGSVMITNKLTR